jgi:excisionase family DNA binding protein
MLWFGLVDRQNKSMRNMTTGKKPQQPCRTYPGADHDDSAPCSVAAMIERHRGMLTPATLAVLLAVSPKSIYAWVKAGTLPAVILGASIRFCPATTAQWLRDRSA